MTYHDPMSKFTKQSIYWPCLFFVLSKTKQTNKKFIHWTLTLWMFETFQLKLKLFFYLIIIKSNEYNSLLMWLSLSQILAKFKILHQAMHHAVQIVRIKEISFVHHSTNRQVVEMNIELFGLSFQKDFYFHCRKRRYLNAELTDWIQ